MATRALIGKDNGDGTNDVIYVHFDGYLEGVGETLLQYYRTQDMVDQLIAAGDRSCLTDNPTDGGLYRQGPTGYPDGAWCDVGQCYEYKWSNGRWYFRDVQIDVPWDELG